MTPFLSVTFGGDSDSASLGVGGAVGYTFTPNLGVEAELGYVFDLAGDDSDVDWSLLGGTANLLYHVPLENGLVPYATAGIGFARSSMAFSNVDPAANTIGDITSTEVGFNLGGGVKVPLSDILSARGDIRYFNYSDAVPDGWRIYGGLSWTLRR